MDFDGNLERIFQSIEIAKTHGSRFRLGPELEITGYGCEDHFLEPDTYMHAWESMASLLESPRARDILIETGMPVLHKNVRYNCRVFVLNGRILLIRPKLFMAEDGNYREMRWFSPWQDIRKLEKTYVPSAIRRIIGEDTVPFGIAAIEAQDTTLAAEVCEELYTPLNPHVAFGLDGVEIFTNGSGSHHELRKLNRRVDLLVGATSRSGGVYLYANQQGCDGGRLYFDGSAMIAMNGKMVKQSSQFSLRDVEVITATVDLADVRSWRGAQVSRSNQASQNSAIPRIYADVGLVVQGASIRPDAPLDQPRYHSPEEEVALGPACWLYDYLRRAGMAGFFLPLSGGADSACVASIVGSMCHLIIRELQAGNEEVLRDVRRMARMGDDWTPRDPKEIAQRLFYTCYMGSRNSSAETQRRAAQLAKEIGSVHNTIEINTVTDAFLNAFLNHITQRRPRFKSEGGTAGESLALQNIQARTRMVFSYLLAQLLPWAHGREGGLLVLGSGNVDETLRGYLTKYDCSSADLNPIGSISKNDIKRFLRYASKAFGYSTLDAIIEANATPELEPITTKHVQTSTEDMGFTYDELSLFGRLRKVWRCGPVSMFEKAWHAAPLGSSPLEIAEKVQRFFRHYSINRHKATVLPPAYHAESYSPDDNRFDLRQFLYNVGWPRQFRVMNALAKRFQTERAQSGALSAPGPASGTSSK